MSAYIDPDTLKLVRPAETAEGQKVFPVCAILYGRRHPLPLTELLMTAVEARNAAIRANQLWSVNSVIMPENLSVLSMERTFCTIQQFTTEENACEMREAFLSGQEKGCDVLPAFEVIGTKEDVSKIIFPIFNSPEVTIRWLETNL